MSFRVVKDDITKCDVDAIANAANCSLLGGGGVDGAIHRAAGPELLVECKELGGCRTGEVRITKGYNLPAKYILHTPGPVWHGGTYGESDLLASCYRNCLALAVENGCRSVAFPSISTGVYGYPVDAAAEVAVGTIMEVLGIHPELEVSMVCFDDDTKAAYERAYDRYLSSST